MCENYEKIGNGIALNLMITKRVREPTLAQVQKNSKASVHADEDFKSIPAWLYNSSKHPGLPEHYITKSIIEQLQEASLHEDEIPDLPFQMNRDINEKLVIIPMPYVNKRKSEIQNVPPLADLENGTVVVSGVALLEESKHNIEIFLSIHDKLLPCCYVTDSSEVITNSPLTAKGRARCYYTPALFGQGDISFKSSQEKLLHRCQYQVKYFDGSVPYDVLHDYSL